MHNLMVRKGGLPPLVECHSIQGGQAALPYRELGLLESFSIALCLCLKFESLCCYFFLIAFISDSSITGAGPEMPPSFLIRQKCTAIKIDATSGIPMQCQI
jgi:hypothetical protein